MIGVNLFDDIIKCNPLESMKPIDKLSIDKTKFFYDITNFDRVVTYKGLKKIISVSLSSLVFFNSFTLKSLIISRGNRFYILINFSDNIFNEESNIRRIYNLYRQEYSNDMNVYLKDVSYSYGFFETYSGLAIYEDITDEIYEVIKDKLNDKISNVVNILSDKIISLINLHGIRANQKIIKLINDCYNYNCLSDIDKATMDSPINSFNDLVGRSHFKYYLDDTLYVWLVKLKKKIKK